jgi:predicted dehydrogenase
MSSVVNVGVIGCGRISGAYLGMAKNFPNVRIAAVADLDQNVARSKAAEFGIERVLTVDEIFADKSIEIVLNLTIPAAHVPLALRALEAGKHTYAEKPLGLNRAEAARLMEVARAKSLRVGCAPDTFMGAGVQTARKLIDGGAIGKPVAFTAFMLSRGHEHWHPSPEFYYQPGGGPMFDMGPYYLTALLQLLGPARRVTGLTTITRPQRTIFSEPKKGKVMDVTVADHYSGSIEFVNGCVGTIIQSFAMRAAEHDHKYPIVIYGTEGTLKVPDPNTFDGPVGLCRFEDGKPDEFVDQPHAFVKGYGRSVGLADMAAAVRSGRAHRCSLEQAYCVLDLMEGFDDASRTGTAHMIRSPYQRTAPMPADLPFGTLD